jgi:ABC-type nickel/cobalt efflux system permease component RcnA
MRWLIPALAALALVLALWLWGFGGMGQVAQWAAAGQREAQGAMAGALRRLQAGDPVALASLWGLCLAYGVVHAAGPGHGKLVLGSYALGQEVGFARVAWLSLGSALGQAGTAILLVGGGLTLVGWGRDRIQLFADRDLATLSAALIALIGVWLIWRGIQRLWRLRPRPAARPAARPAGPVMAGPAVVSLAGLGHGLTADGPEVCAECGHAHGPSLHQVQAVRGWRDGLLLIAAIAARPCTGALFLLILTWQIGLFWAGALGAVAMAIGTAGVTLAVAGAAVAMRQTALLQAGAGPGRARLLAGIEALAGAMVIGLALQMTGG